MPFVPRIRALVTEEGGEGQAPGRQSLIRKFYLGKPGRIRNKRMATEQAKVRSPILWGIPKCLKA